MHVLVRHNEQQAAWYFARFPFQLYQQTTEITAASQISILCFFLGLVQLALKLVRKFPSIFMDSGLVSFKRKKLICTRDGQLPSGIYAACAHRKGIGKTESAAPKMVAPSSPQPVRLLHFLIYAVI